MTIIVRKINLGIIKSEITAIRCISCTILDGKIRILYG